MFTQLELINLSLACHLAIDACQMHHQLSCTLSTIDPDEAASEIHTFENLIKKIDKAIIK